MLSSGSPLDAAHQNDVARQKKRARCFPSLLSTPNSQVGYWPCFRPYGLRGASLWDFEGMPAQLTDAQRNGAQRRSSAVELDGIRVGCSIASSFLRLQCDARALALKPRSPG